MTNTANQNPLALIIGGSSGMGLATAARLRQRGVDVLLASSNRDKLNAARETLAQNGSGDITLVQVNLYNEESVDAFIGHVDQIDRPITYLVNAAGVFKPVPFLDHDKDEFDKYHALNRATFFITQAVARNMKENGGGSIVTIGSMWAKQAIKATPSSAYSMAKAGLHALTQHLAMELGDFNIRANAISPAIVVTTIFGAFIDENAIEDTLTENFSAFHPIGRVGRVEDIAKAADYLLGDDSTWVTGTVLDVDGGVMAGRN